jgi:putative exporter of polyketide antibiotics
MSALTRFLARLLGLYCILVGLSMVTHKRATVETVTALAHNPPALYFAALFTLVIGLAMVLGHNVWSGGVLPVVVTLIGWLTSIRSLVLLFLTPGTAVDFLGVLRFEQLFYLYAAVSLILGVYLTYGGFRSTSR